MATSYPATTQSISRVPPNQTAADTITRPVTHSTSSSVSASATLT